MEDNTHTSKQAYVRQPHPSQTTYKPHETKRPQPTRLYETKVPCGAAYIIWPRKAVSMNICASQYCTPTKPNTFLPCPAAKQNVIPPSCYELLYTTPKTTFHSSTTSPSECPHRGAEKKRVPNDLIRIPHSSVRCLRTGRSHRTPVR